MDYVLKPLAAQIWTIPTPGAEEDVTADEGCPNWVYDLTREEILTPNDLGGLDLNQGRWSVSGLPGDVVVRYANGDLGILDKDCVERRFDLPT